MELTDWIEGYRRAWEGADAAAAASLFTEDATYRSNIFEAPHRGRDGITAYWESVTSSQSDVSVAMGRPFVDAVDGTRVTVEFWTVMRVDGGETALAGCLLLDFEESGLCRRLREYWSFAPSTVDPPPEWGE
jgi:hypothetical protein